MLSDHEARLRESETAASAALDVELRFLAVLDTIVRRQRKAENPCGDGAAEELLFELREIRAAREPPAVLGTPTFSRTGSEIRVDVHGCRQLRNLATLNTPTPAPAAAAPTVDALRCPVDGSPNLEGTDTDAERGWSFPCEFASLGSLIQLQFACAPEPASPKEIRLQTGESEPTDTLIQQPDGWQLIDALGWFLLGQAKRTIPVPSGLTPA